MIKTYQVMGMSCAACATRVQKAAMKAKGVENADVNLMQNILTVTCSDNLKDENVIKAVTESGYGAKVMDSTLASITEQLLIFESFSLVTTPEELNI